VVSIEHACESLKQAVDSLAPGPGRVRERLERAALFITHIQSNDVPDGHLRRMLNGIKDDLTYEPPRGVEGRISATLRITSDEDARKIARRILDLHFEIDRIAREGR
jgi:hypothetical protein